jgi:DNA-binding transcriptional LysR family regulator
MADWDGLRIVLAVFRQGSLAGAARSLKVDETTVGRRLRALESTLGTQLFERTTQGLMPTEAAEAVRAAAETAEAAVLGLQRAVVGSDMRPSGFVRITATETLSSQVLIPALGGFHQSYPEIRLEVFTGYIALDVARGEADIAVRALPPVGNHLVSRRLGSVVLGVYAAPAYLARYPVGAFEAGLCGHDLIGYSDLMSPRPPGDPFLGAHTEGGRLAFTGNSPLGLTVAAEAGLGLATLPTYLAERRPGLVRIWPERSQCYDLLAVMRPEARRSARIRAVVDHLARHFRAKLGILEQGRSPARRVG